LRELRDGLSLAAFLPIRGVLSARVEIFDPQVRRLAARVVDEAPCGSARFHLRATLGPRGRGASGLVGRLRASCVGVGGAWRVDLQSWSAACLQ
jgi:hypothetical protein